MQYRILGPLELEDRDRAVALGPRKQRVLLLCLLVHANEVVSTDELIEALWGADPPKSAPKLLQVYVSQVRQALDGVALETRAPGYVLRVESGQLDARQFEDTFAEGRDALVSGNAALAASLLRRALGLWRGPALHDIAYEPFALAEARRLEELRLVCDETRLAAELELGSHAKVLPELEALAHRHPLREEARRLLMLALYRGGRQSDALTEYRDAVRQLRDELGLEPAAELRALERAILTHDSSLAPSAAGALPGQRVPVPLSSFVGREQELGRLEALLSRGDVRILTVHGAGGSGKTRVALEVARRAAPMFANGSAFVELAPVRDASLVIQAIGTALKVAELPHMPVAEALAQWLESQELLLVVDNFEHVLGAAAELTRIAARAPRLTVLVTSRRVLHVSGEHVFPLQPLPEPAAARLFLERAAAVNTAVDPDADDETIRSICRRLDGLPLAIELAAARTSRMTPGRLLDRLSRSVSMMGRGPRDAPARQQTLKDTLSWSSDLLDDGERRALARLSVFHGGCSLDAAEAVGSATAGELETLVDSSLLQRAALPDGDRLSMLETVREHGAGLLGASGERAAAETAHGRYFAELISSLRLKWPHGEEGLAVVDREIDNLRAASDCAAERGDEETALRIAAALYPYWWVRGHFSEGRERIRRLLEREPTDGELHARALHALASLSWLTGDSSAASAAAVRGVEVGTAANALEPVSHCHTVLGILARDRGEFDLAREHLERSGALAAELGNDEDVMAANENLADLALAAGQLDEARRLWERVIGWQREQGLPAGADSLPRFGLGAVAYHEDRLDDAQAEFARAFALSVEAGFPNGQALALSGCAAVAGASGDAVEGALLLGCAEAICAAAGFEPTGPEAVLFDLARGAALEALGEERVAALLEEGRRTDPLPLLRAGSQAR